MDKYYRTNLRTLKHRKIYYNQIIIIDYLKKIEQLIDENINNLEFAKKIMKTTPKLELTNTAQEAYDYILNNTEINKESIKKLYHILSKEELKEEEKRSMGPYYRNTKEFIINSTNNHITEVGPPPENIEKYMNELIKFINNNDQIDDFIKSQIIHIYLVYIHPYPNVNGRMSRLLATWHLIKNEKYPYIIFNRMPTFHPITYSKSIKTIYKSDITQYLKFIITETENHIEIMKIIEEISKNINLDIDMIKLLEYILIKKESNIESLIKINSIQNRYISKNKLNKKITKLIDEKIIIKKNNNYQINKKI